MKRRLFRARFREVLQRGDDPQIGHRLGDLSVAPPSQRGGPGFDHGGLDLVPSRLRGHTIKISLRDQAMHDPMIGIELVQTSLFEGGEAQGSLWRHLVGFDDECRSAALDFVEEYHPVASLGLTVWKRDGEELAVFVDGEIADFRDLNAGHLVHAHHTEPGKGRNGRMREAEAFPQGEQKRSPGARPGVGWFSHLFILVRGFGQETGAFSLQPGGSLPLFFKRVCRSGSFPRAFCSVPLCRGQFHDRRFLADCRAIPV